MFDAVYNPFCGPAVPKWRQYSALPFASKNSIHDSLGAIDVVAEQFVGS
jgi:hypothetical protein